MTPKFQLRFANNIIEHLGVKLYQNKPTNVIAEYVANGWDAGAEIINVEVVCEGENRCVSITDDGTGMDANQLAERFLVIGLNRRMKSPFAAKKRKPMGRKGIGKLAGFGISKKIDVISSSKNSNGEIEFYWLRFDLDHILQKSQNAVEVTYEPELISDGGLIAFEDAIKAENVDERLISFFRLNLKEGKSGTCVILQDARLPSNFSIERLCKGLANRFALNLIKDSLRLLVNGKELEGIDRLLQLQEFSIGKPDQLKSEIIEVDGKNLSVEYWIGFVDITKIEWTTDDAGVAVYAHNKIVQDRPFFFDNRGNEIYARYMMGFVYADWLDEDQEDHVSTDRSSINWDAILAAPLLKWGKSKVSQWVNEFADWKKKKVTEEIDKDIDQTPRFKQMTSTETQALKCLLKEIYPTLRDDDSQRQRVCSVMADAWMRKPMRETFTRLWNTVGGSDLSQERVSAYLQTIDVLCENRVPELLDWGVTVAGRLHAIGQMQRLVDKGASETHLQRLIEDFPWLLKPNWECLTKNQQIRTLVERMAPTSHHAGEGLNNRPDFVYLSDADSRHIVVIELKGAEYARAITIEEYRQLGGYLDTISDSYPDADIEGILIGNSVVGFPKGQNNRTNIRMESWRGVLEQAVKQYEELLKTLLIPTRVAHNDRRFELMSELAGDAMTRVLQDLRDKGFLLVEDYDGDQPVRRSGKKLTN